MHAPDAVQRGATAERCTADPGPSRVHDRPVIVTVPGPQRITIARRRRA